MVKSFDATLIETTGTAGTLLNAWERYFQVAQSARAVQSTLPAFVPLNGFPKVMNDVQLVHLSGAKCVAQCGHRRLRLSSP